MNDRYLFNIGGKIKASNGSQLWYGVEHDVTATSPTLTRIGNLTLHRADIGLPCHESVSTLVADNGTVTTFTNWGTATLDGSEG